MSEPQEWAELKGKVFEALGEASLQWEPIPFGVFDSSGCEKVGNKLWQAINAALADAKKLGYQIRKGEILDLEQQLDAERDARGKAEGRLRDSMSQYSALSEQLAAEREAATKELNHIMEQLAAERELREGDNKLIRALAEDAGIKITASDKLLGAQWEQFHDGVMQLAGEREKRESIESINKSLAQALDAERKKVKTLVDALEVLHRKINQGCERSLLNAIINDALAKEGK
jgi:hypothetical protein